MTQLRREDDIAYDRSGSQSGEVMGLLTPMRHCEACGGLHWGWQVGREGLFGTRKDMGSPPSHIFGVSGRKGGRDDGINFAIHGEGRHSVQTQGGLNIASGGVG